MTTNTQTTTTGENTNTFNPANQRPKPLTEKISIVWMIDDIKEVRPDLTDKQCSEVLDSLKNDHDATVGINWETIDVVASYLFPEKQLELNLKGDRHVQ